MELVAQMIQKLEVEMKLIPGKCTSLCQPVDVGFDEPFKDCVRRQWINWMIGEGVVHGTTSLPSRAEVVNWVNSAMVEMKAEG